MAPRQNLQRKGRGKYFKSEESLVSIYFDSEEVGENFSILLRLRKLYAANSAA
jgi:hypothetical protein